MGWPTRSNSELRNEAPALLAALPAVSVEGARAERYHIFTRKNAGAVLVLVKATDLKKYTDWGLHWR